MATGRGVILGLLLGVLICTFAYVNDVVWRLSPLAGSTLPAAVFGAAVVLVLAVNPLIRRVTGGQGGLTRTDLAMTVAVAMVACVWPGPSGFRSFTQLVAVPGLIAPTQAYWLSTQPMSYISGGSPRLAAGYVTDWDALLAAMASDTGLAADYGRALDPVAADAAGRLRRGVSTAAVEDQRRVIEGINRVMTEGAATHEAQVARRRELEAALPGAIRSMPRGDGVLLSGGRASEAVMGLSASASRATLPGPLQLPWGAWWPTLRLWGGVLLLMAAATVGMMLVVYPQWSASERLPFPIARFLHELAPGSIQGTSGQASNTLLRSGPFWWAAGIVMAIHLINGLGVWFGGSPVISLKFDLTGLGQLMPDAQRQYGFSHFFAPTLVPTVIGFAYFIESRVALSVGLSALMWIGTGSLLVGQGIMLSNNRYDVGPVGPALRFGAYVAIAAAIVWLGRRHYWASLKAAVGLSRGEGVGLSRGGNLSALGVWLLVLGGGGAAGWLVWHTAMSAIMAAALVAIVLMMWLVLARINAETGLFAVGPEWIPWVMLAGLIGSSAIGLESLIVMAVGGLVLAASPQAALAPLLGNALRIGEQVGGVSPRRGVPWLAVMIVVGFVVALVATLTVQYRVGLDPTDSSYSLKPAVSVGSFTRVLTERTGLGDVAALTRLGGWGHLQHLEPHWDVIAWSGVGLSLALLCLAARVRLTWWPLHPVVFLVWGTFAASFLAASFLVAWVVKTALMRLGGERAYRAARPAMVGLIVGELTMVVVWGAAAVAYRAVTGQTPPIVRVLTL